MPAIRRALAIGVFFLAMASASRATAQDLFEIQVDPYLTVPAAMTMVETHSKYFESGTRDATFGDLPMNHQSHLTVEVTHGFTNYFELARYFVTATHVPGEGGRIVGTRIRPRMRFKETQQQIFFNISLSVEFGFQKS